MRPKLSTPAVTPTPAAAPTPAVAPAVAPVVAPVVAQSAFRWDAGEATRASLLPIRHHDVWAFRKTMESLHWTAQEVDLTRDRADWRQRMSDDQRHYVRLQLGFFARVDIDLLENIGDNFIHEVDCLEAEMTYAVQADQECVHAEAYGLQIEAVLEGAEREATLDAAARLPVVGALRAWVRQWMTRERPLGERLVAFAAIEGVMFSSSFAALQWLRELNLLPGIVAFNEFIVRDEGVHTMFACMLIRDRLRERPPQARAEAIFAGVVALLDDFVAASLPVRLIGMNADLMCQYVRFQADCVLAGAGYAPVWRVSNPFPFMDKLTLNAVAKTNFFEARPTQYSAVRAAGASRLAVDDSPVD